MMLAIAAFAQVPRMLAFQGYAANSDGPMDGSFEVVAKLLKVAEGGQVLWQETHADVAFDNGVYQIVLGSETTLDLDFQSDLYLDITIEGETMTDRVKLTSVPWAMVAQFAMQAGRADSATEADHAATADSAQYASVAGIADSADYADHATTADNATVSDSSRVSAFVPVVSSDYMNPGETLKGPCDADNLGKIVYQRGALGSEGNYYRCKYNGVGGGPGYEAYSWKNAEEARTATTATGVNLSNAAVYVYNSTTNTLPACSSINEGQIIVYRRNHNGTTVDQQGLAVCLADRYPYIGSGHFWYSLDMTKLP